MASSAETPVGFKEFFRRYTKTWLHALSAAALTGFGTLAVIHRGFVVLAVASYVLPPIVLYLIRSEPVVDRNESTLDRHERTATREEGAAGSDEGAAGSDEGAAGSDEGAAGRSGSMDDSGFESEASATPTVGETGTGTDEIDTGTDEIDTGTDETRVRRDETGDGRDGRDTRRDEPAGGARAATHWTAATAPTDATLFDVAVTGKGAYAVGDDGVVLADDGNGWHIVLSDGVGGASNALRGVDATPDGDGVWVAGDGGAVARLDGTTGRHVDFSSPRGRTDTWDDVAVGGAGGDELVLLANGSGEVVRGRYWDGEVAWDTPVKPGSGSSLSGVALATDSVGYACDTNDEVFETTDGGETFREIGVESTDGTLTDVAAAARGDALVSDDDGVIHRHDDGTWIRLRLGDEPLAAVALRDDYAVACGGTVVHERPTADADWDRRLTSVPGPLLGISAGPSRAVAVGRDGAIVERT